MNKLLFATLCALMALVGCADKKGLPFDPYTQIALNAATPKSKIAPAEKPYDTETILRYAMNWSFQWGDEGATSEHGIGKESRDFVAKRLFIGGNSEIVTVDNNGNPKLGWLLINDIRDVVLTVKFLQAKPNEWYDIMLENNGGNFTDQYKRDTIGYIPNRVVREAEKQIKLAFDKGDYDECLRLFHSAYVFTPITGAEWRALKAKNQQ